MGVSPGHSMIVLWLSILFTATEWTNAQKEPTITCGTNTHRILYVGPNTKSVFKTQRETRRCTLIYKATPGCPQGAILTCGAFFLPNKDPFKCRRGDRMYVKASGTKPRPYCEHRKPTRNFPAVAQKLKVVVSINPDKMYPEKGVTCRVECDN